MSPAYCFKEDVSLRMVSGAVGVEGHSVFCPADEMTIFDAEAANTKVHIITLTRRQSLDFQYIDHNGQSIALLTNAAVIASRRSIKLEYGANKVEFSVFPQNVLPFPQDAETFDAADGTNIYYFSHENDNSL
jgi:hypothetical protein